MAQRTRGSWVFPAVVVVTAAAAAAAQSGATPTGLWVFVVVLGGWVITLCLHEFAHAAVALACGDTSVRARGYLTLNPLRYTNLGTSLLIPVLLLAIGGIPLPGGAVLIQPGGLRRRWYASLVSAAGPATNLVCGVVLALIGAQLPSALGAAISFLALLQFVAVILNILPVPGFDGFGIIAPYLPAEVNRALRPAVPWIPLVVFAILWSVPGMTRALFDGAYSLMDLSHGSSALAGIGASLFQFWR